jgi:hypothetical protein
MKLHICAEDQPASAFGPTLPTFAVQQVGSYLGYTGCDGNVVGGP